MHIYNVNKPEKKNAENIYSCMCYASFIHSYVVVNHHGWHLNGVRCKLGL